MNNAGTAILKEAVESTAEDISTMLTTNFESCYHFSQLAHPLLKASGSGTVVFITSTAGVVAQPLVSLYAASKGSKAPILIISC